jgi:hypothetical protein
MTITCRFASVTLVRSPFKMLVLVLLVVGVPLGAVGLLSTWRAHQDEERFVARTDPYMPLAHALTRLATPSGIGAVQTVGRCSTHASGVFCRVDFTLAGRLSTVNVVGSVRPDDSLTMASISPDIYVPPTARWLTATTF